MIPILWAGAVAALGQDTTTCSTSPGADVELAWTPALTDGVLELTMAVDPALSLAVDAQAALGGLTFAWVQGPYVPDVAGNVVVRIEVPDDAYLDDAALDYLTVLRVRVTGTRDGVLEFARRAPPAYLAWPNGAESAAVVWDQGAADREAPNGLLSDTLRAQLGSLPSNVRVHPPLSVAGGAE